MTDQREQALAALDQIASGAHVASEDYEDMHAEVDRQVALVRAALTPPLPADLAEIQARADAAGDEVDRLTTGNPGTNWRWSIPANPERDSDLILAASIADVPALVAELAELRARPTLTAEEARAALYAIEYPWRCETDGGPDEDAVNALRAIAEGAGS